MHKHCGPTNVLPAVVHPTKCCVNHTFSNNVVPHIHPQHTTTVNHINYEHQHFFPQTQSVVTEVTNTQSFAPPRPVPGPFPAPGFGVAPAAAPGFGAAPGAPGFGAAPGAPGFGGAPGPFFGR